MESGAAWPMLLVSEEAGADQNYNKCHRQVPPPSATAETVWVYFLSSPLSIANMLRNRISRTERSQPNGPSSRHSIGRARPAWIGAERLFFLEWRIAEQTLNWVWHWSRWQVHKWYHLYTVFLYPSQKGCGRYILIHPALFFSYTQYLLPTPQCSKRIFNSMHNITMQGFRG